MNITGQRLREARKRANMTQAQLAELAHYTSTCVSQIETGRHPLNLEKAERFAEILGTSAQNLIGEDITAELKRCPFCGSGATYDTDGSAIWVICKKCGARCAGSFFTGKKGAQIVADRWNMRAGK